MKKHKFSHKDIVVRVKRFAKPFKAWGNSNLAFNYKNWVCSYCGLPLKNGIHFEMALINSNPIPYVFCSPTCEKGQLIKLDMVRYDK